MLAKKLAAMLTAAVMIFSAATPAFAENNSEWEELYSKIKNGKGGYAAEDDFIFVIGLGGVTKGTGNFYKKFARQAAKFNALRLLAETIAGLKLDPTDDTDGVVTVRLEVDDITAKELSKARQVGEAKFYSDGVCEVIMKMPYPKKR